MSNGTAVPPSDGQVDVPIAEDGAQEVDFKEISQARALELLKSTTAGLTSAEAAARLVEYGPNMLPDESRNQILVFFSYMWNPLSWAMEAAAILAIALLDYVDFVLILVLLFINASISYIEESNADKAIRALTSALAPKARVLRDGKVSSMPAADLVPGDVIVIRLGEIVPADVKVLTEGEEGNQDDETPLQCDQAALTGESLPVKKFSGDVCFSGSTIKQGERHCVVYATGLNTFFGRAAALLIGTENVANLQKVMTRIGALCLITITVWVIITLAVQFGHYGHECLGGSGGCPTLTNILVLIVGGVPIAMPTVLSVTLALGAFELAKDGAIVSRMSAVEEMAGMDILCSDKTGTLTLNKLTVDVSNCFPLGEHTIEDVLKYGALSANIVTEEPIDVVLHDSYADAATLWEHNKLTKYVPFNPTDKYTVAIIEDLDTGRTFKVMKGAPQVVVKAAEDREAIQAACDAKITEYASRGFRALGIAVSEGNGTAKWQMVGIVPLWDPPRHDTKETIERCLELGCSVKMITGDQLLIGKETARQLGMGSNIFTTEALVKVKQGIGLVDGHISVEQLIEEADGFAEVFPEHKFFIVKTLQERGHMIGMTGDGVNDAPALKKADVGIAVADATDAARGAADIVLTKPGLYTIVGAIIGARKIFQRMTTYSRYTIAMTFRICFTFGLLTVIYDWYFPTILIVLLAVFNDGAMIALSKDRVTPSHFPNRWDLPSIFASGIVYGLYLTISSWSFFYVLTHTRFFEEQLGMFSLDTRQDKISGWCDDYISDRGLDPTALLTSVSAYADQSVAQDATTVTIQDQCMAEQRFVRDAMTRSALYVQVSVSGQALVFVVRTAAHSLRSRAGTLTYVAFFVAQMLATLVAIFGFNGYEHPRDAITECQFCVLSSGGNIPFFTSRKVPLAGTEWTFTASVLGCTYYVVAAWIWAAIWYLGLDPIKWMMFYALDEEGFRRRPLFQTVFNLRGEHMGAKANIGISKLSMSRVSALPRASLELGGRFSGGIPGVGGRITPSPAMIRRASVVRAGGH